MVADVERRRADPLRGVVSERVVSMRVSVRAHTHGSDQRGSHLSLRRCISCAFGKVDSLA
jgi:hypothetical protein